MDGALVAVGASGHDRLEVVVEADGVNAHVSTETLTASGKRETASRRPATTSLQMKSSPR